MAWLEGRESARVGDILDQSFVTNRSDMTNAILWLVKYDVLRRV